MPSIRAEMIFSSSEGHSLFDIEPYWNSRSVNNKMINSKRWHRTIAKCREWKGRSEMRLSVNLSYFPVMLHIIIFVFVRIDNNNGNQKKVCDQTMAFFPFRRNSHSQIERNFQIETMWKNRIDLVHVHFAMLVNYDVEKWEYCVLSTEIAHRLFVFTSALCCEFPFFRSSAMISSRHEISINFYYCHTQEEEDDVRRRKNRTISPFGKFSNFFVHVIFGLGLPVKEDK